MTQLNITVPEEILKALMMGERGDAMKKLLEITFNAVLQKEASEQVGAERFERTDKRMTYRNGFRIRQFTTRVGSLTLHVPKFRDGTFSTQLFQAYEKSEQALILSLMEMVVQGVSTRKVKEITETLCGTSFSKSTVSALCQQLDPAVYAFKNRSIEKRYPFIIADAIYMKSRERGSVRSKGMLIAIGISETGEREILGFEVGDGENYTTWSSFFQSLKARGLQSVDYIVSDDHGGLVKAVNEQFCEATWQRCQAHFIRNMVGHSPKDLKREITLELQDLINSPNLETAYKRKEAFIKKHEKSVPKVSGLLDQGFDDITAVYSLPEDYRKRMRTSNCIERLNEEIRRRERVIRIFPNVESMTRLIGSLLLNHHEKWISGKNYFNMSNYHSDSKQIRKEAEMIREKLKLKVS